MDEGIGIGFVLILFILGIFFFICDVMSAFIVPNYMQLTGWDWIFMFFGTLGVMLGASGGSLITIYRR